MKFSRKHNHDAPGDVDVEVFDKHKEQRKIVRSCFFYNIGIFFSWASFVSIFNLQSSINIEDGLGTNSLAVAFVVEIVCCTFWAPVAIKKFGAKVWLIIGELGAIPYMVANLFPSYYTLMPTAIILAVLQSSLWPSMCMLNVFYASLYSGVSKRPKETHTILFSGYFFTSFQASQVFGSTIAYIVLYGFDQIPIPTIDSLEECDERNVTSQQNTTCVLSQSKYGYCGANDCQNASVISGNIDQYKPVNRVSLYVLIGVSLLLAIAATLVHYFFIPNDKDFEEKQKYYYSQMEQLKKKSDRDDVDTALICERQQNDSQHLVTSDESSEDEGIIELCIKTAKSVINHITIPKFWFLIPITLYNGLTMAFVATELTRAYTSCIIGVQWVGICMALYGLADAIFSWVVGKFGRRIGRFTLYVIGLLVECGNYAYLLVWSPSSLLLLSIVGVFFTFGVTDGIFQTIINVTHIDYFSKNEDNAMLAWNMLILSGFAIGYLLSPILCVSTRIYVNLGFLLVGFACVAVAECFHRQGSKAEDKTPEQKNPDRRSDNEPNIIAT